jgi:hypothetical protein
MWQASSIIYFQYLSTLFFPAQKNAIFAALKRLKDFVLKISIR